VQIAQGSTPQNKHQEVRTLYHAQTSMESSYQEAPSWIRRGHTRKPNWLVLLLYWVFDLILDFGPMFSAMVNFLGRSSLVVVNLVILAGTIVLSAAHSLELLRFAGFTGGLEWVAMVVWELVFIFSSIVLANDFRRGNWRSGWAPWAGFLMGFAFVELSNYLGMADNWIGRTIGISTPILLLVSKGLLAHQFKRKTKADNPTLNVPQMDDLATGKEPKIWNDNQQKAVEQHTENAVENGVEQDQKTVANVVENAVENMVESTGKMVEKTVEETVEKMVEQTTEKVVEDGAQNGAKNGVESHQETVEKTVEEIVENVVQKQPHTIDTEPELSTESSFRDRTEEATILDSEEPTLKVVEETEKMVEKVVDQPTKKMVENAVDPTEKTAGEITKKVVEKMVEKDQENNHQNDQTINQENNQVSDEKATEISDEKTTEEMVEKPTQKTKTERKKRLTRKRTSSAEKMKKQAKKWAKEFYQQNGKLPGRVRVEKGVGCGQNIARTALEELKEELGIAS
jgi:hypothetical protein